MESTPLRFWVLKFVYSFNLLWLTIWTKAMQTKTCIIENFKTGGSRSISMSAHLWLNFSCCSVIHFLFFFQALFDLRQCIDNQMSVLSPEWFNQAICLNNKSVGYRSWIKGVQFDFIFIFTILTVLCIIEYHEFWTTFYFLKKNSHCFWD